MTIEQELEKLLGIKKLSNKKHYIKKEFVIDDAKLGNKFTPLDFKNKEMLFGSPNTESYYKEITKEILNSKLNKI